MSRRGRPLQVILPPAPEPGTLRQVLRQVPWRSLVLGLALAFLVGFLIGIVLKLLGWWGGAAWEVGVLAAAQETVSTGLDAIFLTLPYFGTNYTLAPIIAIAAVLLIRRGHHLPAVHLVVAQLGSWFLNPALKLTLPRARPDLFELRGQYALPAYPSGHSIAVLGVMFTVAYIIDRTGHGKWGWWVVGLFFLLNSYSRIYLAVHWPTDVIGGTAVGLVWLIATLRVFGPMYHQDRGKRRKRKVY